jgi:ketosteroid isomerase-like protein
MKISRSVTLAELVVAIGLGASAQTGNAKATDAIRKADQQWMAAYAAKDADKAAAFMATDGAIYAPNAPAAQGVAAAKNMAADMFKLSEVKLTWTPNAVEVAKSGDLGFTSGSYEFSFKDPSGKTIDDKGKYVTVWKKQADGSWKVLRDVFNSDMPPPSMQ